MRFLPLIAVCAIIGCTRLDNVERRLVEPDSLLAPGALNADAGTIKAHMPDGSVYIFSRWTISHENRRINGTGSHLDAARNMLASGSLAVAIDSVALVETNVRTASTTPVFFAALGIASVGLAVYCFSTPKACFGSCPTIYSTTAGREALEAESFSHSIAPLFEMRDADRISVQPDARGELRLEIRNEALETHYINHLELLEVAHAPGGYAVPDGGGGAFVLDNFAEGVTAVTRSGNDVSRMIAARDGIAYETDSTALAGASPSDAFDHIDLSLRAPAADSAAVLLTFRASLLSTVLFYDFMLAGQGTRAIEWLTTDLSTISGAIEIGDFYTAWMGIRVSVRDGRNFVDVGRVGGAGPIAWDERAVIVPVLEQDSVRIRLSFLADAFRIDRIVVAQHIAQGEIRPIPLARVDSTASLRRASGTMENGAGLERQLRTAAAAPDEHYLMTYPGTSFEAVFDVGVPETPTSRTYFVASQGYYIEWIRRDWLQRETRDAPVLASDEMLGRAFERWRKVKAEYEDLFFRTKIPVR